MARVRPRIRPEIARAIPSSKGGETPGKLQESQTGLSTRFTRVGGTRLLYSADRWVKVKITLQTAGPVDVGQSTNIAPVLSGKGRALVTGQELELELDKGSRLYYICGAVNRLLVTVQPIPWMQQLAMGVQNNTMSIVRAIAAIGSKPAATVAPATSSSGKTLDKINLPAPSRRWLPKLKRGL